MAKLAALKAKQQQNINSLIGTCRKNYRVRYFMLR
jgi:hypothetical protein